MSWGDDTVFFFALQVVSVSLQNKGVEFIEYNTHHMVGLLLLSNLIMIGSYLLRMHSIPPQIPLFYSLPIGEDQLVEWWMIFLIPVLMNILYILNSFIYHTYFQREDFERSLLYYVNMIVIGICTYLFIRIIFLVS